jgi:hypothetical protein
MIVKPLPRLVSLGTPSPAKGNLDRVTAKGIYEPRRRGFTSHAPIVVARFASRRARY